MTLRVTISLLIIVDQIASQEYRVLQQLLSATQPVPPCNVALIADTGSWTAKALLQFPLDGLTPGGVSVFSTTIGTQRGGPNATVDELATVMRMSKELRFLSGCFAVVFLTDSPMMLKKMLDVALSERLLIWSNIAIIMIGRSIPKVWEILETNWVYRMMNSLLVTVHAKNGSDSCQVFRHMPYSPSGAVDVEVARCSSTGNLTLNSDGVTSPKFDNFHLALFPFASLPYLPFWDEKEVAGGKHFSGTDFQTLLYFSRALNFTPNYVQTSNWQEITDILVERKILLSSCLYFYLADRLQIFDLTYPLTISSLVISVRETVHQTGWDSFLKPLELGVWVCTCISVLVFPVAIVMIVHDCWKRTWPADGQEKVSLSLATLEAVGLLLGQPFSIRKVVKTSFRVLLSGWLIFGIVIGTGYKSNLVAVMTLPPAPQRIETLSELAASGLIITGSPWSVSYKRFLESSGNEEYRSMAGRYSIVPSVKQGLDAAILGRSVHSGELIHLAYAVAADYSGADSSSQLYIMRDSLSSFMMMGMAIPHDAPYKQQLDKAIHNIASAGLYTKWHQSEIDRLKISKLNGDEEKSNELTGGPKVKKLTLAQLRGPFIVAALGYLVASSVFMGEILLSLAKLYSRRRNHIRTERQRKPLGEGEFN